MTRQDERRILVALLLSGLVGAVAQTVSLEWGWLRLPVAVAGVLLIAVVWRWVVD